jgi:nucleoid DNA-binding protein
MAANTNKPPTKSEIYARIVEDTGLTRKDVAAVFESLNGQIKKNLGGRGAPGMFTLPGLLKMRVVKKPARKAQKGVPNPFKPGELMDVAAKPASKAVKVSALKGLKDMV